MAVELPQLQRIRDDFVLQMHAGLSAEGGSSLPMIPTLVDILPAGCAAAASAVATVFLRHSRRSLHLSFALTRAVGQ